MKKILHDRWLILGAICSGMGVWCAIMEHGRLCLTLVACAVYALKHAEVLEERSRYRDLEKKLDETNVTISMVALAASRNEALRVYSPGCKCRACQLKEKFECERLS